DAAHIERCVRAFNPWPMIHFEAAENSIKVWQSRVAEQTSDNPAGTIVQADKTGIYVETGKCVLVLDKLKFPGKKAMSVQD
ncbi:methionyl-tRNA formyltransferase, partial [Vibrio parahaemolyticus]|nr:methionyl-tRNA formyltransferase [Vibrio parahaemolyticus]